MEYKTWLWYIMLIMATLGAAVGFGGSVAYALADNEEVARDFMFAGSASALVLVGVLAYGLTSGSPGKGRHHTKR